MLILNKEKQKTILFIHGFYANAGFWLPYIEYFNDYKLVILNLKVNELNNIEKIIETFKNKSVSEINYIISHSLGSIFSTKFSFSNKTTLFDICPIGHSKCIDKNNFIYKISTLTGIDLNKINEDFDYIENSYKKKFRSKMIDNKVLLIPDKDEYFNYNASDLSTIFFEGNHFNVLNAIKYIHSFILKKDAF